MPGPTRVNVYVDGYNLYYGALRGPGRRWLDLRRFAENLLQSPAAPATLRRALGPFELGTVRYFTARASARPDDPAIPERQHAYLRAVASLPATSIHYGTFIQLPGRAPQEKGSDVNLATWLLLDAFDDEFDVALVVSNDSDLSEPIRVVRERFGRPVAVALPVVNRDRKPSVTLRRTADFAVHIDRRVVRLLKASQFPQVVQERDGGRVPKPASW